MNTSIQFRNGSYHVINKINGQTIERCHNMATARYYQRKLNSSVAYSQSTVYGGTQFHANRYRHNNML